MKPLSLPKGIGMNSIAEIKTILHHYIAETDDVQVLSKLEQYVKKLLSKEDKIIAYTAQGQPLNQAAYKREIDDAIAEVDRGEIISQEEMEKDL
ncbi:hypothetical protein FNH22_31380 [Fulvivirga sp. M361]|uniref:hypothetical protein n=1 Tax=Fulvivirga sp. M361 TaxID=2594266 RepID=UPI00117AA15C|nr:hypothetical protein [Fulvivirga sp. M361]TRX45807.1 hypothetical protein FNH22_31380 [Fulvivirga sp. M361]